MHNVPLISESTMTLLYNLKNLKGPTDDNQKWISWILRDIYHPDISPITCVYHLINAVTEARSIPQMGLGPRSEKDFMFEMLEYPFKKRRFDPAFNKDGLKPGELTNDNMEFLISKLRLTNIGWCTQYKEYSATNDLL